MKYSHRADRVYFSARQRCNNKNCKAYKNYGGRGIKCLMTKEDFRMLWDRDKADKLAELGTVAHIWLQDRADAQLAVSFHRADQRQTNMDRHKFQSMPTRGSNAESQQQVSICCGELLPSVSTAWIGTTINTNRK